MISVISIDDRHVKTLESNDVARISHDTSVADQERTKPKPFPKLDSLYPL